MKALLRVRIYRFRRFLSSFFKDSKNYLFLLIGVLITGTIGFVFHRIFRFIHYNQTLTPEIRLYLVEKLLLMIFLMIFVMLVISAMISTLNIFFLSGDTDLLLSSPLKVRTVFAQKAAETFFNSSFLIFLFSAPVLITYSVHFMNSVRDFAGLVTVFFFFLILSVMCGILVGMIIPMMISVKRLQPVLSVFSIIMLSGAVIFLRLLKPENFLRPQSVSNLIDYVGGFDAERFAYYPFYWTSRSIGALSAGKYDVFLNTVILYSVVLLLFVLILYFVQKKLYLNILSKIREGKSFQRRSSWKEIEGSPITSLFRKEYKTFFRTPEQWSQILIVGALIVLFLFNMEAIPVPVPYLMHVIVYFNIAMAVFIVAGLSTRFTFTTIPMEYPGIVYIVSSPLKREYLLRFKYILYLVPHLVLALLLFFIIDYIYPMDPLIRCAGIIVLVPLVFFITSLSLYFSIKVDNSGFLTPQHLVVTREGISLMIWSFLLIFSGFAVFVPQLFSYFYNLQKNVVTDFTYIFISFAFFTFVFTAANILLYRRCRKIWLKREF